MSALTRYDLTGAPTDKTDDFVRAVMGNLTDGRDICVRCCNEHALFETALIYGDYSGDDPTVRLRVMSALALGWEE